MTTLCIACSAHLCYEQWACYFSMVLMGFAA